MRERERERHNAYPHVMKLLSILILRFKNGIQLFWRPDTQHNDTQHDNIQYDDSQLEGIQHNN